MISLETALDDERRIPHVGHLTAIGALESIELAPLAGVALAARSRLVIGTRDGDHGWRQKGVRVRTPFVAQTDSPQGVPVQWLALRSPSQDAIRRPDRQSRGHNSDSPASSGSHGACRTCQTYASSHNVLGIIEPLSRSFREQIPKLRALFTLHAAQGQDLPGVMKELHRRRWCANVGWASVIQNLVAVERQPRQNGFEVHRYYGIREQIEGTAPDGLRRGPQTANLRPA